MSRIRQAAPSCGLEPPRNRGDRYNELTTWASQIPRTSAALGVWSTGSPGVGTTRGSTAFRQPPAAGSLASCRRLSPQHRGYCERSVAPKARYASSAIIGQDHCHATPAHRLRRTQRLKHETSGWAGRVGETSRILLKSLSSSTRRHPGWCSWPIWWPMRCGADTNTKTDVSSSLLRMFSMPKEELFTDSSTTVGRGRLATARLACPVRVDSVRKVPSKPPQDRLPPVSGILRLRTEATQRRSVPPGIGNGPRAMPTGTAGCHVAPRTGWAFRKAHGVPPGEPPGAEGQQAGNSP